ncbi:hypothetical protein [Pseudomonas sp. 91RF]|uniref:hypothetical protein n=1 Tax=Pseudomonas sp. 91RF TaxID=2292261 RepID=UPI00211552B1|nr:hypothetical protein [Pseudomonas sp. 91RF]
MSVLLQGPGLVQQVSLFLRKRIDPLLRRQASVRYLLGNSLGEVRDLLMELHTCNAICQMTVSDGQCLSKQVAGGVLYFAQIMLP